MRANLLNKTIDKSDILYLKQKGLTEYKISKMTGIPLKEIEFFLKYCEESRQCSGIC